MLKEKKRKIKIKRNKPQASEPVVLPSVSLQQLTSVLSHFNT